MRNRYVFILIALLMPFIGAGQSISLQTSDLPEARCVGSRVTLIFTSSGNFAATNTFVVQLSTNNGNTFTDLPSTFSSSPVSFTLPPSVTRRNDYRLRITSTDPIRSSNSISFNAVVPPTADLLPENTFPNESVNPYTGGLLRMRLSGGGSYSLVLTDSTRLTAYSFDDGYIYSPEVRPARSTAYRVASVRNVCGDGTVGGGTVPITVNPVSIQFLRPTSLLCSGSTLQAHYVTSDPLPVGVVFQAELIYPGRGGFRVAVPVSGTASPLQLTLPGQLEEDSGVRLRIYDPDKSISAYYGIDMQVRRSSLVTVRMNQERVNIPFGGMATLSVSLTALQGGSVLLSNGRQFSISSGWQTYAFDVDPAQTTSYSIVSAGGACNVATQYGNRSTTVEVRPGFRVDSLSTNEACAGTPVTLYYTTTPGYTVSPNLWILLDAGDPVDLVLTRPGQATFVFPETARSVNSTRLIFYLKTNSSYVSELPVLFKLKTKPQVSFAAGAFIPDSPQLWSPALNWTGGGETMVELASGERLLLTDYQTPPLVMEARAGSIYVTRPTTYSIVAAQNECGRREQSSRAVVTFSGGSSSEQRIYIRSVSQSQANGCPGSTRWFNFGATGTYAANNQFRAELSDQNGQFSSPTVYTLASGATSFSVTLPQQTGNYRMRVVSTSPQLRSDDQNMEVWNTSLPLNGTVQLMPANGTSSTWVGDVTIVAGEAIRALYSFSGVRDKFTYELSDGQKGQVGQSNLTVDYAPTTTTSLRINKLADRCGRASRPASVATAVVVPQRLTPLTFQDATFCVSQSLVAAFQALGDFPSAGVYVVQASEDKRTYRDLSTTGTSSPLTVMLPEEFAGKSWFFRVVYRTNTAEIASEASSSAINIYGVPNVTLSGLNGEESLFLRAGSSVTLLLREERGQYAQTYLTTSQAVSLTKQTTVNVSAPGTYSIALAQNQCGYGPVKGQVRVTRAASLNRLTIRRAGFCVGEPVSFSYVMAGDFDARSRVEWSAINTQTRVIYPMGSFSATTGAVSYTAGLPVAQYDLQVVTSAPSATIIAGGVLRVQTPVSVSLISSVQVIYANDFAALQVRAVGGLPCSITLSTGEVATLSLDEEYLTVRPAQTTSYSISQVQNGCGVSGSSGVTSITVIPTATTQLRLVQVYGKLCGGNALTADVATTGRFGADNTFTLSMLDASGKSAIPLGNANTIQSLTALIPASVTPGFYSFRVSSSNPLHAGSTWGSFYVFSPLTATLSGNTSISKGDSTRISVALTGTPPWQFVLTDFFGPRTFTTSTTPYSLTVKPDTTVGFRLTEVRNNQCGVGTATGTALITVTKLLATEPALPLQVRTWPNPTAGWLQIEGDVPGRGDVLIELRTVSGTLVQQSVGSVQQGKLRHRIDLSNQPAGVYILTAGQAGRQSQFKVLKQ